MKFGGIPWLFLVWWCSKISAFQQNGVRRQSAQSTCAFQQSPFHESSIYLATSKARLFMSESPDDDPLAELRKKRKAILKKKKASSNIDSSGGDGAKDFSENLLKKLETVESDENAIEKAKAKIEALKKKEADNKQSARQQNIVSPSTSSSQPQSTDESSGAYGSGVRVPEMAGITPPGTELERQRPKPQKSTAARVQTEFQLPGDENDFHIPYRIGFGTMSWGDTSRGFTTKRKITKKMAKSGQFNAGDVISAFNALTDGGITFVDTAESYGRSLRSEGLSAEQLIAMASEQGLAATGPGATPVLASKFEPRSPLRFGSGAVVRAIQQTCERMEVSTLDLYQVDVLHPLLYIGGGRSLAKGLANAVDLGLCNFVGVCNFGKGQLQSFHSKLEKRGVQLATNQFEFSLVNRDALKNGLIETCKELGVTPIAHTPLAGGLASGKYTALDPTGGTIGKAKYDFQTLEPLTPIHEAQERVAGMVRSRLRQSFNEQKNLRLKDYRAKPIEGDFNQQISTAQVALHYIIAKGAVPVPGINNLKEAEELLGCVGWGLIDEEVSILDDACDQAEKSKPTTTKTNPFLGKRRSNRVDMGF